MLSRALQACCACAEERSRHCRRVAEQDDLLRAAAWLRARCFYVYPPERKFAGEVGEAGQQPAGSRCLTLPAARRLLAACAPSGCSAWAAEGTLHRPLHAGAAKDRPAFSSYRRSCTAR